MGGLNDETAPQQVHPDKPPRDDPPAASEPNEDTRGEPQHEAKVDDPTYE
jgi:hypothetical protein